MAAIEPVDVAGFGEPGRNHWYPFDGEALVTAAPKLGVRPAEVSRMLARTGTASARILHSPA